MKRTPLYSQHVALGARMMPFGGFEMPVQYSGIIEEHLAVRKNAGLFDVSHMGEIIVENPNAFDFVQRLVTNDARRLEDGKAMYALMCDEDGGIIDDLIVYRIRRDKYMLVVNAANIETDFAWMRLQNHSGADLRNASDDIALLALQGPRTFEIAQEVTALPLSGLKFYHFMTAPEGTFLGCEHVILSHTGYTGEQGLEIYCHAPDAEHIWTELLEAGAESGLKPAGLGARDTLRLEVGYALYGNDIDRSTNPFEAGLGWVTRLDKGDFIGSEALGEIKERGPERRLVAFVMEERGIPRSKHTIVDLESDEEIGRVTSGSQSPMLNTGIGMGYVRNDPRYTQAQSRIGIVIRDRTLAATVKKPPLFER